MPEIPNRLQEGTPIQDAYAYINQAFDALDDENRTKIIKNAATPQILFGYQKAGFGSLDYGFKVSKINPSTNTPYDVTTATDDQLSFSSAFDYFKIVGSGTQHFVPTGASPDFQEFIIPHGLPFTPLPIAWYSQDFSPDPPIIRSLPDVSMVATAVAPVYGQLAWTLDVSADDTNVNINWASPTGGSVGIPIDVRYFLLRETISNG